MTNTNLQANSSSHSRTKYCSRIYTIDIIQQIADVLQKFKSFGQVGVQLRSARLTRLLIELYSERLAGQIPMLLMSIVKEFSLK